MSHPLERKVAAVRRRALGLLWTFALCCFTAVAIGLLLLAGLTDYWLRLRDPGVRLLLSLGVLGAGGWAAYWFLWPALTRRLSQIDVARRIERRFPQLNDRLTSSVDFLSQADDDAHAGSAALRRAVVVQTAVETESLNLFDVLDWRAARRAAAAAVGLLLIAALLSLATGDSARLALLRLARPLGGDQWPRQHELEFVNPPARIASGRTLELELRDRRGRLPDEVFIQYRYRQPDGSMSEETTKMQLIGAVALAQRENVTRALQYRADGGDDHTMDWIALDVVDPPQVQSLSITLSPPAYTGWPRETSERRIRALRGTQLVMSGVANRPLESAKLKFDGGAEAAAEVSPDGMRFSVPAHGGVEVTVDKSGAYWFELLGRDGVVGGAESRWEIRAIPDQPPTVAIEQLASNLFLTPDAVAPLKIGVKDDLAIRAIELHYSRSDRSDQGDFKISLFTGPETAAAGAADVGGAAAHQGESRIVEHALDLAPLALSPGTQLTVFATADDYSPQTGQSAARMLSIITPKELFDRLSQREEFILGELGRVLKMQQEVRGITTALEIQLRDVGQLTKPDQDRLQGAELSQRQVARTLISPDEGVSVHVEQLLVDLENNRLSNPDTQRRMRGLLAEITRLGKEPLPLVERELISAVKGSQSEPPQNGAVKASLAAAGAQQDHVIESLERLLGDLSQWESYRRFAGEVELIRREQQTLQQDTAELGKLTLTRDVKDLDAQQQADLRKLGQRQSELARRFDRVGQQMDQMSRQLRDTDPMAAETLGDAVELARTGGVGGKMRESSQQVEQNQIGRAGGLQQQIVRQLQELLDVLANRREQELSRLVKRLREAEQQLDTLRKQQDGLRKKINEAAKINDEAQRRRELERLSRQQKDLQAETERIARQLQRLQADKSARSASRAASRMGQAGEACQGGTAEAAEHADEAKRDLDDAQQQLAQRRRQAEQELLQEELARVEDALKSLHQRQISTREETMRLEHLRRQQGRLTRPQAQSVQDLARTQDLLREETSGVAKKITEAEAFTVALDGAASNMARAVQLLGERDTGAAALQAQEAALARLAMVMDAMQTDKGEPGNPSGGGGGGEGGGKREEQQGGLHDLAELKLLKLMQMEINRRTEEMQKAADARTPPTEQQTLEFTQLAQEQGRLADLVLRLSKPAEEDLQINPVDPEK